jgi:hypothetical protein
MDMGVLSERKNISQKKELEIKKNGGYLFSQVPTGVAGLSTDGAFAPEKCFLALS